jgi:hypothetical protein
MFTLSNSMPEQNQIIGPMGRNKTDSVQYACNL